MNALRTMGNKFPANYPTAATNYEPIPCYEVKILDNWIKPNLCCEKINKPVACITKR